MTASSPRDQITEDNYLDRQFAVPWQYAGESSTITRDEDGFPVITTQKTGTPIDRQTLHAHIWRKFHSNPHVNTNTRGLVGRLTGNGFATVSDFPEIEEVIEETETDYRNRLYDYWPKFVTRAFISGELFLCFTVHKDGFIEVDFVDPDVIDGEPDDGIIFHPRKTRMPLIYCIKDTDNDLEEHIPSIYLARYPDLYGVAKQQEGFSASMLNNSRSRAKAYRSVGGFYRFMVSWDLGLITPRSTSHLQTVLQ